MTSCAVCYDIIYHPFPINSQYLKTWGLTALRLSSSAAVKLACIADVIQPRLVTSVKQCQNPSLRVPNRLNKLPEMHFEFPFILMGKSTIAFLNGPIMARTQILVHRWGQND